MLRVHVVRLSFNFNCVRASDCGEGHKVVGMGYKPQARPTCATTPCRSARMQIPICKVLGAWCLPLSAWCLVLGAWCLVLGSPLSDVSCQMSVVKRQKVKGASSRGRGKTQSPADQCATTKCLLGIGTIICSCDVHLEILSVEL